MSQKITVTHIYHSCFTVELEHHFFIFDYYKGELGPLPQNKKIIYVASHSHEDHYTPDILSVPGMEDNLYLLSSDIKDLEREDNIIYLEKNATTVEGLKKLYSSDNVCFLDPDEELYIDDFAIVTFGSTDRGISILIEVEDITIFHSGDLYYWCWKNFTKEQQAQERTDFLREIAKIENYDIDIAFFPVDPRLEENAFLGGEIFLDRVQPQVFFPMHNFGDYEIGKRFQKAFQKSLTEIQAVRGPGDAISIDVHLM